MLEVHDIINIYALSYVVFEFALRYAGCEPLFEEITHPVYYYNWTQKIETILMFIFIPLFVWWLLIVTKLKKDEDDV